MKYLKKKITNFLMRGLLKAVVEDDVVLWDKLTKAERDKLVFEAKMISDTKLWKRVNSQVSQKAKELMFEKSTVIEDVFFAKAILYALDLLNKKINKLADKDLNNK